jgi:hypothetical protein
MFYQLTQKALQQKLYTKLQTYCPHSIKSEGIMMMVPLQFLDICPHSIPENCF